MRGNRQRSEGPVTGLAAVGVAAFVAVCCAGGPLLAAAVSGAALGVVLGAGTGAVVLVALIALAVLRARRRACTPTATRPRDRA
jgi:hypothetical protein